MSQEDQQKKQMKQKKQTTLTRRSFLKASAAGLAAASFPSIFVPNEALAQNCLGIDGTVRHVLFIRLNGGFRFPVAFNSDVGAAFNPFGTVSDGVPSGVDWGVGSLLSRASFLTDDLRGLGMRPVHESADRITVLPTIDHEPESPGADGNHSTGLERYLTGYVNGGAGVFTRIFRGLEGCYAENPLKLPPFVMGANGMARGLGEWAPYRPPVLSGATFDRFQGGGIDPDNPPWYMPLVKGADERRYQRAHPALRGNIETYMSTREAVQQYTAIFGSDALKIDDGSEVPINGISNAELSAVFGNTSESRQTRLALRLFGFGCPAVYFDQGGYDYHSGEENALPGSMDRLNRLISGLLCVLPKMQHPEGGTYWDHTLVVFGSEFSRTARGQRFNSANGSDHTADYATRFMSMPVFGGPVQGGRVVGATTRKGDMAPDGARYSYRSLMNTLMEAMGCDPSVFFPASPSIPGLIT